MKTLSLISSLVLAAGIAACGGPQTRPISDISSGGIGTYSDVQYGTVSGIEQFQAAPRASGIGAAIGGVAGGLLGSQIGGGRGRDAATVAGVVGGAVAGHELEKRRAGAQTAYRVIVRTDHGGTQAYEQASIGDLRVGDRVVVENGQVFRRY